MIHWIDGSFFLYLVVCDVLWHLGVRSFNKLFCTPHACDKCQNVTHSFGKKQ